MVAGLKGIEEADGTIRIGAMTTQAEVIASELLAARLPILRETALQIADPQVRYCGTIGGNVANGDPGNDMPAVMLALGAEFVVRGPSGERAIPARDYYRAAFTTALAENEVLTGLRIPAPPAGHGWAYEKMKRKVGDYATAAAAVILVMDGGACRDARIALTNLADVPLLAEAAGQALIGTPVDDAAIEKAVAAAVAITDPASDLRGPAEFRKHVAGVMVRRAINSRTRAGGRLSMAKQHIKLTVNGKAVEALVEPRMLLIHFLREEMGLTGAHIGCETSHCGACTVDLDGRSVKSCTVFAVQADGGEVLTVEGMATADGLHPIQAGFIEHHGLQCGFCTPGMIVRTFRLLQENPDPSEAEIRTGLAGNLCRCTGYQNIVKAVRYAADRLRSTSSEAPEAAE